MIWKFTDDRPVYQQIMAHIQAAVLAGEFPPGSKIPSVRDLAAAARVNPNTMQHALHELEQDRLLVTMGTNGRHVTEDAGIIEEAKQCLLQKLTKECAEKFLALGVPLSQAAQLLEKYEQEKEEV